MRFSHNIGALAQCSTGASCPPQVSLLPPSGPHWLPAGRALLWVASYLIYFILWSIRRAICGAEANFLPALREGDQLLQPRAVAVDVVRLRRLPRPSGALHDLAARTRDYGGAPPLFRGAPREEGPEEG